MSIFKPVTLGFKGRNYTIKADNIMRCLAQVEEFITLNDLTNEHRVPLVKLSQAYCAALRYAGADVTDEEIYESVFEKAGVGLVARAVGGLLAMMIPPTKLQDSAGASAHVPKKPRAKRKN